MRVAAKRGRFQTVEDRAERRFLQIGDVGMPAATEILGVVFALGNDDDLRMAVHRLHVIMHIQRAETPAEPDVLLRSHLLVAEEDHAMVEQGTMDRLHRIVVEFTAQIDAFDDGARCTADRLDGDIPCQHGFVPPNRCAERSPRTPYGFPNNLFCMTTPACGGVLSTGKGWANWNGVSTKPGDTKPGEPVVFRRNLEWGVRIIPA